MDVGRSMGLADRMGSKVYPVTIMTTKGISRAYTKVAVSSTKTRNVNWRYLPL
jgi:hypothetical protein